MKRRLLIVGSNAESRASLAGYFGLGGGEWVLEFAPNGLEALAALAQEEAQAVLADVHLPEMNGALFLQEVLRRYPRTLRFLCCEMSSGRDALNCIGTAHHFLLKPVTPEVLEKAVERAMSRAVWLPGEAAGRLMSKLRCLPSPPRLYLEVVKALRSAEATMESIGSLIAQDPAMSAKLLQLANSAAFGLQLRVNHPTQAVTYLGLETTQSLVLLAHSFSYFDQIDPKLFSLEVLWQHSVRTGHLARKLARMEGVGMEVGDESFTAGLLHDLGKLLLAANEAPGFQEALRLAQRASVPAHEAEREVFGADHAELGASLLSTWGLPGSIIEAIALHHYPARLIGQSLCPLTLAHVANVMAHQPEGAATPALDAIDHSYLAELGLQDRLAVWWEACRQED